MPGAKTILYPLDTQLAHQYTRVKPEGQRKRESHRERDREGESEVGPEKTSRQAEVHTRTHSNSYAQIHTTEQIMCCIFLGALNLSRGLNCIYHNKATRLVLCASFPYLPTSLPLSLALSCCAAVLRSAFALVAAAI